LGIGKVHRRASARGRVGIEARHQILRPRTCCFALLRSASALTAGVAS
jgi:hypothetical protein